MHCNKLIPSKLMPCCSSSLPVPHFAAPIFLPGDSTGLNLL
nr:MAG TPA: hypothetical protein [Caudoviricetes sp.]